MKKDYSDLERFLEDYERDFEGLKGLIWIWWIFVKIGGDEKAAIAWKDKMKVCLAAVNLMTDRFSNLCMNGPLRELKEIINSSNINSRDEVWWSIVGWYLIF